MNIFKKITAGLILSLSMSAHAAIIDWEGTGVDFYSYWYDADTLRIEIDAGSITAGSGWDGALSIDSIAINGDWTWDSTDDITLAAVGTFDATMDGSGLNANGCESMVLGGNHQCWDGLLALSDDMYFDFTFGADTGFSSDMSPDAHLKVRFVDGAGGKVGSLLSTAVNVSEPAMISLLGAGLIGLGFARRRRNRKV